MYAHDKPAPTILSMLVKPRMAPWRNRSIRPAQWRQTVIWYNTISTAGMEINNPKMAEAPKEYDSAIFK